MDAQTPTPAPPKRPLIQKILILLLLPPLVLALIVMMQKNEFRVERGATISGPPELVFAQVNDLQKWQAWSPWAEMDPNAKVSFGDKIAGKDAWFSWSGNDKVGEGTMTVTDSQPNQLVQFRLEFRKPFTGTNTAEFTFKPEGEKTRVTWAMFGKNDFMGKAISLFIDCDKMVGGQFEEGLKKLDVVVQKAQK